MHARRSWRCWRESGTPNGIDNRPRHAANSPRAPRIRIRARSSFASPLCIRTWPINSRRIMPTWESRRTSLTRSRRVGAQQPLGFELGPQRPRDRMAEVGKVLLQDRNGVRAGNDRGNQRMGERELQRGRREGHAVSPAYGLDPADLSLALALSVLPRGIEIVDAFGAGLLQDRIGGGVVDGDEALAHRRTAEAEAGDLDGASSEPSSFQRTHRVRSCSDTASTTSRTLPYDD